MGAKVDGFVAGHRHDRPAIRPDFDAATIELRDSKAGNYLGITITITRPAVNSSTSCTARCPRIRW